MFSVSRPAQVIHPKYKVRVIVILNISVDEEMHMPDALIVVRIR